MKTNNVSQTQRLRVLLRGENVAPYLYGYSSRILLGDKGYPNAADFRSIQEQVDLNLEKSFYGVRLRNIRNINDLHVGDLVLVLDRGSSHLTKSVFRVTEIKKDGDIHFVYTLNLWPEHSEGWEGFFDAKYLESCQEYEIFQLNIRH